MFSKKRKSTQNARSAPSAESTRSTQSVQPTPSAPSAESARSTPSAQSNQLNQSAPLDPAQSTQSMQNNALHQPELPSDPTQPKHQTSDARLFSTPMMQQYMQLKQKYPDCILLFRLGDFYELFLEDAILGSELLNITLTARPRGKDGDIPMAGVPFHSVDSYIPKLTQAGHKVAICEQTTPADGKTLVDRNVVRIITPGTILSDTAFTTSKHNYIFCALQIQTNPNKLATANSNELHKKSGTTTIGMLDISTGTLKISDFSNLNDDELTKKIELIAKLSSGKSQYNPLGQMPQTSA